MSNAAITGKRSAVRVDCVVIFAERNIIMSCKYEYIDNAPQQIEKNRQEKQQAIDCFNTFMEDVFDDKIIFDHGDMMRAFVNGWSSGVFHIKR